MTFKSFIYSLPCIVLALFMIGSTVQTMAEDAAFIGPVGTQRAR